MYIYKTAVVGAGAMGAEIAQTITFAGIPVLLKDIDQARVDQVDLIIFEIDSFGGRVDSATEIVDHILNAAPVKTVAYVVKDAWSAGALVAIIFIAALVNALHPEHRHDGRA